MRNKKIAGDSATIVMKALEKASTYSSDMKLFKSLGLEPFKNIPTNKNHFIGEIKFDNGSEVKIWVNAMPSLFWKFEIVILELSKLLTFLQAQVHFMISRIL